MLKSSIVLRFLSRSFKTAFSSQIRNNFEILSTFPYNLQGGISENIEHEAHLKLKSFIHFLDKSLEQGFNFAYNALLEGLQLRDLEFLNQNLENRFFRKVEGFPSELNERRVELSLIEPDNEDCDVLFTELNMILGVRLQRDANPKGLYKSNITSNREIKFTIFTPNKSFFLAFNGLGEIRPLLRIPVIFRSRKKIALKGLERPGEESHKVVFECEGANLAETSLFSEMIKIAGKAKNPDKMGEIFHKFFFTKESEWKITDIDDFMAGNEF